MDALDFLISERWRDRGTLVGFRKEESSCFDYCDNTALLLINNKKIIPQKYYFPYIPPNVFKSFSMIIIPKISSNFFCYYNKKLKIEYY